MDDASLQVIDEFGHRFEDLGAPYNLGRTYAVLMLSSKPLSQDDIASSLGVSQSVVSTTLKQMVLGRLVEKTRLPGSRKTHYQVPDRIEAVMAAALHRRLTIIQELFRRAAELELSDEVRERIDHNLAFYEHLHQGMTGLLAEWHEEGE